MASAVLMQKLIYAAASLCGSLLGFAGGRWLRGDACADAANLAVGGLLLSLAFAHLMPAAAALVAAEYPASSLVAVLVFAAMTLFAFVRDSLSLMDDSILTVYNSVSSQALIDGSEAQDDGQRSERTGFALAEGALPLLAWAAAVAAEVARACYFSGCDVDMLNRMYAVEPAVKLVEAFALAQVLAGAQIGDGAFWALAAAAGVVEPALLVALPDKLGERFRREFYGYAASVLLGVFFYFGALGVHTGVSMIRHNALVMALVLLAAFAVPAALQCAVKTMK